MLKLRSLEVGILHDVGNCWQKCVFLLQMMSEMIQNERKALLPYLYCSMTVLLLICLLE